VRTLGHAIAVLIGKPGGAVIEPRTRRRRSRDPLTLPSTARAAPDIAAGTPAPRPQRAIRIARRRGFRPCHWPTALRENSFSKLFEVPNRFWSLDRIPALIDFGARHYQCAPDLDYDQNVHYARPSSALSD